MWRQLGTIAIRNNMSYTFVLLIKLLIIIYDQVSFTVEV